MNEKKLCEPTLLADEDGEASFDAYGQWDGKERGAQDLDDGDEPEFCGFGF